MRNYALIRAGVAVNVIVTDDTVTQQWLDALIAEQGYDTAVDVTGVHPRPAAGWTHNADGSFMQPADPVPVIDPAVADLIAQAQGANSVAALRTALIGALNRLAGTS